MDMMSAHYCASARTAEYLALFLLLVYRLMSIRSPLLFVSQTMDLRRVLPLFPQNFHSLLRYSLMALTLEMILLFLLIDLLLLR